MTADARRLRLTTDIVAAYLENNVLPSEALPSLIRSVHAAIGAKANTAEAEPQEAPQVSKAQIRKSITHDALISFEDGRPYRMLRRHLTSIGLTPAEYRAKWGLPKDYPMTAPAYSARRSELAKAAGLGSSRRGGKSIKSGR
jgi:predicted transcriptional regulator